MSILWCHFLATICVFWHFLVIFMIANLTCNTQDPPTQIPSLIPMYLLKNSQFLSETTTLLLRIPAEHYSETLLSPPHYHFSKTKERQSKYQRFSDTRIDVLIIFSILTLTLSFDWHFPIIPPHRELRHSRGCPLLPLCSTGTVTHNRRPYHFALSVFRHLLNWCHFSPGPTHESPVFLLPSCTQLPSSPN